MEIMDVVGAGLGLILGIGLVVVIGIFSQFLYVCNPTKY